MKWNINTIHQKLERKYYSKTVAESKVRFVAVARLGFIFLDLASGISKTQMHISRFFPFISHYYFSLGLRAAFPSFLKLRLRIAFPHGSARKSDRSSVWRIAFVGVRVEKSAESFVIALSSVRRTNSASISDSRILVSSFTRFSSLR